MMPPDALPALAAVPANHHVLSVLEDQAVARPPDDPWAPDGYELHTHPDLRERLDEVAVGQGSQSIGLYGVPILAVEGVIYAVARGTSRIYLRILSGPAREEALQLGGTPVSPYGPEWVGADAWLSDLPSAAGTQLLRSWVAAAVAMTADRG